MNKDNLIVASFWAFLISMFSTLFLYISVNSGEIFNLEGEVLIILTVVFILLFITFTVLINKLMSPKIPTIKEQIEQDTVFTKKAIETKTNKNFVFSKYLISLYKTFFLLLLEQ